MNLPANPGEGLFDLHWWVEGNWVAHEKVKETGDGFMFVCEQCPGESRVWAYRYFPNRALIRFYGACRNHSPLRGEVPGSLVLWFHDELERMPAVLVEREYNMHLNYYLKETSDERDTFKQAA